MRYKSLLLLSLVVCGVVSAAESAPERASWQHHEVEFYYLGFTSLYTCDGLEDKVKLVLKQFGARKDAKVRAMGCDYGAMAPSPHAWVKANFDVLAPMAADDQGESVNARWAAVELTPRRPDFMGEGECELVAAMRPLITGNFAVRDLNYRATCTPHQISLSDYSVRGQVLRLDGK